tara:strand:+ start:64 stop:273 length:210 start_codon:yes stop_codon:yes gene_type:complete
MAHFEISSSDQIAKLIVLAISSAHINRAEDADILYNICKYEVCEANGFNWEAEGFDDMFWEVFNDVHQA